MSTPLQLEMATFHPRLRPLRRLYNRLRLMQRSGVLAVDIRANNVGFFAQLNWSLYILAHCEQYQLIPQIRYTGPLYGDILHHDWFHDFFQENQTAPLAAQPWAPPKRTFRIVNILETDFATRYSPAMTIEEAHRLFTTHYRVKQDVQAYVDRFIATEFAPGGTIGLHYRGTDKQIEADPVDWPRCFRSVMKRVEAHPELKQIFISSDDPKFIDWFAHEATGTLSVLLHPDEERSHDGKPVHISRTGNRYRKGFEALVNCLLLSRCTALMRSASCLSGWSSIFNPALPMTLLNEPYDHMLWFPDRELVKRSDNRFRAA
jgi:hypothetical protein